MEFKPCPFCGSNDIVYDNDTGRGDESFYEWIECQNCGAKHKDIERWNTRVENKLQSRVEELERELNTRPQTIDDGNIKHFSSGNAPEFDGIKHFQDY